MTTCSILGLTDTTGLEVQALVNTGASGTLLRSAGTGSLPAFSAQPIVDSSGRMTNSSQPCFLATLTTSATNAWGNNTLNTVIFNTVIFDNGSNYSNSTGAFTAPVTGKYLFTSTVSLSNNGGLTSNAEMYIVGTSRTLQVDARAFVTTDPNNFITLTSSSIIDMTANDTVKIQISGQSAAGTKTGTYYGQAGTAFTMFSGHLVC